MSTEHVETVEVPDTPNPKEPQHDPDPTKKKAEPAKYIRRADWGAKPPKWIEALETPVKKVVLTWTETDPCNTEEECMQRVKELQELHMKDEKCPDIRHNFLVGGDGALYEGRGFTRMGPDYPKNEKTHEELYGKSIEIAFIQRHVRNPHYKMIKAASDCMAYGTMPDMRWLEDTFFLYWITKDSAQMSIHKGTINNEGNLQLESATSGTAKIE